MAELKETFYFTYDEDGYYTGVTAVSDGAEKPENGTTVSLDVKDGYWYKFNKNKWNAEKIPETVEDTIGISFPYEDPYINFGSNENKSKLTSHEMALRALVTRILNDTEDARIEVSDGVCTVVAIDAETKLNEAKEKKTEELTKLAHKYDDELVCEEMIIKSSLGFSANADIRSQNNVRGLLSILSATDKTAYADADNAYHMLTKENLETLLTEIITNGNNLYAQKWAYRAAIEKCASIEEVDAITFNFVMTDFSAENAEA